MRKKLSHSICLIFALCMLLASFTSVSALETRASDYFSRTEVWATAMGRGKVVVEIDIVATHTLKEVGATKIVIKERQSNGSYETVKTFSSDTTTDLIAKNSMDHYALVSYQGKSGTKYYAVATLYGKDSSGSETMYQATNTITA